MIEGKPVSYLASLHMALQFTQQRLATFIPSILRGRGEDVAGAGDVDEGRAA